MAIDRAATRSAASTSGSRSTTSTVAAFSEVERPVADGDVVDYREATDIRCTSRKLLGLRKFNPITLKRGYTKDTHAVGLVPQDRQRRATTGATAAIVLMDEARKDVLRWNFENAWPNKIEGPSLKAAGNEVAIESIELVHEGIDSARGCADRCSPPLRHPGRLLRSASMRAAARFAAAHRHRRLRRHRRARSGRRAGAGRVVAAVRVLVRRRRPRWAISPTRCAPSSRTAAGAAGWCGSRPTTLDRPAPRRRSRWPAPTGPVWRVSASSPAAGATSSPSSYARPTGARCSTTATDPDGRWCTVPRVAGFAAGDAGAGDPGRVVPGAAPRRRRGRPDRRALHWVHPEPGAGLPYDAPCTASTRTGRCSWRPSPTGCWSANAAACCGSTTRCPPCPRAPATVRALLPPVAAPLDPVTAGGTRRRARAGRGRGAAAQHLHAGRPGGRPRDARSGSPAAVTGWRRSPWPTSWASRSRPTTTRRRCCASAAGCGRSSRWPRSGCSRCPTSWSTRSEPHPTRAAAAVRARPVPGRAVGAAATGPGHGARPAAGVRGRGRLPRAGRDGAAVRAAPRPLRAARSAVGGGARRHRRASAACWTGAPGSTRSSPRSTYPWLVVADPNGSPGDLRLLPAAGHVAGPDRRHRPRDRRATTHPPTGSSPG